MAPLSCTGLGTRSPCGPSLIPGSLGLPLHVSRENEHPPPGGHPGPGRQTSRKAAWVLPAGVCSPGTPAGHLRLRRPGACLGSFLWHRLEGALGLPAPAAHPVAMAVALALPPAPPCDERAGEAGRTRRKLSRPNIISQMQAPWLLGASGDAALLAVLGLVRACGCPA